MELASVKFLPPHTFETAVSYLKHRGLRYDTNHDRDNLNFPQIVPDYRFGFTYIDDSKGHAIYQYTDFNKPESDPQLPLINNILITDPSQIQITSTISPIQSYAKSYQRSQDYQDALKSFVPPTKNKTAVEQKKFYEKFDRIKDSIKTVIRTPNYSGIPQRITDEILTYFPSADEEFVYIFDQGLKNIIPEHEVFQRLRNLARDENHFHQLRDQYEFEDRLRDLSHRRQNYGNDITREEAERYNYNSGNQRQAEANLDNARQINNFARGQERAETNGAPPPPPPNFNLVGPPPPLQPPPAQREVQNLPPPGNFVEELQRRFRQGQTGLRPARNVQQPLPPPDRRAGHVQQLEALFGNIDPNLPLLQQINLRHVQGIGLRFKKRSKLVYDPSKFAAIFKRTKRYR